MRVVGLLSGGKDSVYAMMQCVAQGHEVVAVAHLTPPTHRGPSSPAAPDRRNDVITRVRAEMDSYMYQTVGSEAVGAVAECLGIPLYTASIEGSAVASDLGYEPTKGDEVESLYELLRTIQRAVPGIEAVSSGAIGSTYQKNRVESVCGRLGLVSIAPLWQREQGALLDEMIESGVCAITVKVAVMGLEPSKHLGKTLAELRPHLRKLEKEFGMNVCGEGGEFESLVLDCPLFKKRLVIDKSEVVEHTKDMYAAVSYLRITQCHTEPK
eukprot:m51a1_g10308 hypothetical protein (268) ;mRNA; r:79756-81206